MKELYLFKFLRVGIFLWIGFSGFSYALSTYEEAGNTLNREETHSINYSSRFNHFSLVLEDLQSRKFSTESRISRFLTRLKNIYISGRGEFILRNTPQGAEYYKYFDLVYFNLIDFLFKLEKGIDPEALWPRMQPRLTADFLSSLQDKTTRENFVIRRSFIMDFSLSNRARDLTASEKLRLLTYIQKRMNFEGPQKMREEFFTTDKVLEMIQPYLKFSEKEMVTDLFEFNVLSIEKIRPKEKTEKISISPPLPPEKKPEKSFSVSVTTWIVLAGLLFFAAPVLIFKVVRNQKRKKLEKTAKMMQYRDSRTPFEDDSLEKINKTGVIDAHEAATNMDAVSQMMISTLPNRYQNIWKVSKGGMGMVFGAHDKLLKRKVAIKMILPSLCDDTAIIHRFINEARSVAALDHPNILKIFDVGGDQYPFFVMEYLEGISLEDFISKKRKMNSEELKYYGAQMADAFKYCHEKGIIHRDIKPANMIVINNFKLVKVVDFGIAKDPNRTGLTQLNVSIGSPLYMAPEQMKENISGIPSDIYSFGLTLYKMGAGDLPFESGDLLSRLTTVPKPILQFNPELNKLLASLIMKCIEKDPKARFENFEQIRNILIKIKI